MGDLLFQDQKMTKNQDLFIDVQFQDFSGPQKLKKT